MVAPSYCSQHVSAVLLAHVLSCLPKSPCIAACLTRRQGLFGEFCEQLEAYLQKMDCVYLLNWDALLRARIRDCCPVAVHNPGDEEEEREEDVNPEE